jgi:hypothetical protein
VTVAVVLAVVMSLVLVAAVAWPLMRQRPQAAPAPDAAAEERKALEEALERSLAAIREIEFDHRSGHLSNADFRALDAQERARAVDLIRRRDELDRP